MESTRLAFAVALMMAFFALKHTVVDGCEAAGRPCGDGGTSIADPSGSISPTSPAASHVLGPSPTSTSPSLRRFHISGIHVVVVFVIFIVATVVVLSAYVTYRLQQVRLSERERLFEYASNFIMLVSILAQHETFYAWKASLNYCALAAGHHPGTKTLGGYPLAKLRGLS